LAFVYLHAGQYDEALYWARQAVQTAEKLGSTLGMIFAECVLMYSLIPLGRYLEAKRISRKALPTAKDLHITETVGQFMTLLALTYREENQPEAARIWARRCAMLCQESGYIQLVLPFMLAVWAWAELAIGRPVEARQLCLRSLALIEQSGGKRVGEYASVAVVMGHITLAEGKRDSTADWVRRALASPAKTADATTKAVLLAAEILSSQSRAEPAAELLAFVAHSPLAWHATRRKAEAALRELESELPPDIYTAAVARGQRRELDALVAEILAHDR
jgi:tetratricopeptide (TPR) repeat protein